MSEVGNTTGGVTGTGTGGPMIEKKDGGGPTTVAGGGARGGTGGPMIEKKEEGGGPGTVAGGGRWQCKVCGSWNPDSATECQVCGTPKDWEPPADRWTCPACGAANAADADGCVSCGEERTWTQAEVDKMREDAQRLNQQGANLQAQAENAKEAGDKRTESQRRKESDEAFAKGNELERRSFNIPNSRIKG